MIEQEYTVQDLKDAILAQWIEKERDEVSHYQDIPVTSVTDEMATRSYVQQTLPSSPDNLDYDQWITKATEETLPRYQYGKKLLETLKVVYSDASICLGNDHLRELAEKETLVSPALAYPCGWRATQELYCWKALALRKTEKK